MGLTQAIGTAGEEAAARWLAGEGFEILARNWRSGRYELDIVARRGDTLHFVEVKSRDEGSWQSPEDALTPAKKRAFLYAARAWVEINHTDLDAQLDLIAIDTSPEGTAQVRYIPEAVIPRW